MNEVANTVLEQLGGSRFIAMTGAKKLVAGPDYLRFRVATRKINTVTVRLNGMDLYDVEFGKSTNTLYKVIATEEDVYADNLGELFTKHTGLYTKL